MMWQFNNQMFAKTLVFSKSGQNLDTNLIQIYQDLSPLRIGISENKIFVEVRSEIDDFELLSQCQPNGLFEILQGDDTGITIDSCPLILNSLEEIRYYYCQEKSQRQSSHQIMLNKVQLSQREQAQKSNRRIYPKDQLIMLQCNTIAIDIEDQHEEICNNAQIELEESIAIDITDHLQETNIQKESFTQLIPGIEENRKQDEQSFGQVPLCDEPKIQKQIAQQCKRQPQPPLTLQKKQKLRVSHELVKKVKNNKKSKQLRLELLLLLIFVILIAWNIIL